MAYTKEQIKGFATIAGTATASGTNTYTATIPEVKALNQGLRVLLLFSNANTTSSTLDLNGLRVKNILKGVTSTLSSGDILQNSMMELAYDGTSWQLLAAPQIGYVNSTGNNLFNYYNFK